MRGSWHGIAVTDEVAKYVLTFCACQKSWFHRKAPLCKGRCQLTEGLFYEVFQILSYILYILNFSFTTPPAKITDFCHLPLHRGGFGRFLDNQNRRPQGGACFFCNMFLRAGSAFSSAAAVWECTALRHRSSGKESSTAAQCARCLRCLPGSGPGCPGTAPPRAWR